MPEFRTVNEFPNYEVSEFGDVRRRFLTKNIRVLDRIPYLTTTGYFYIVLRDGRRQKACAIHRLVAAAFIGDQPEGKPIVAHYDGNKLNNHYTNLRWATESENQMDRVHQGCSNRGERFGRHVLTLSDVVAIKSALAQGEKVKDLSLRFSAAETTIKSIKQGASWFWVDEFGRIDHSKRPRRRPVDPKKSAARRQAKRVQQGALL